MDMVEVNKAGLNCYIYTRVSTEIQIEGFSLSAQLQECQKMAEIYKMNVVGIYSDEGKSGKDVEGRPEFQRMMRDIEYKNDNVSFILVFKLSRFGRNATEMLSGLNMLKKKGVYLWSVKDSVDNSTMMGQFLITILSAMAEMERVNILEQTQAGRIQKAKEGKWNGGFAPYGYKLENGELKIVEDEAETIRLIFDKYVNTNMGGCGIAKYMNEHGYKKKIRQNGTLDSFSAHFVNAVIDNPVYCGKIAFGRRKTEKINGTRNQFHIVEQDEYPVYDGIHEAIVSEADWNIAQDKRKKLSVKREKVYSLEHEHLLSGILVCPVCGAKMYGNVNRKKKPDGTLYKDYFFYACKHRLNVDGHKCDYHRQWNQDVINSAVEEVISKIVSKPDFAEAVKSELNSEVDTSEAEKELELLRKRRNQLIGAKNKLANQIDSLNITDKHYDQKYQDMQDRLYAFYDDIEYVENEIKAQKKQISVIKEQKIKGENVYQFLALYDIMYKNFTDAEKKQFLNQFLESVEIFNEEQPSGQILKSITFKFPVFYDGETINEICWDGIPNTETVVLMSKKGNERNE